jgi:hypothetical protein
MKFAFAKSLAPIAACAAALMAAAAPSAASADVHWTVNGTFDDGGSLSGFFDINVYGYLSDFDLTTTAGGTDPGFEYTPETSYFSNGSFFVDAQPGYQADLHLAFLGDLSHAVLNNPIDGGVGGPSYECVGSFSCYLPAYGATRYLTGGAASVPEPAGWALMILGFGGVGAALRGRRSLATA